MPVEGVNHGNRRRVAFEVVAAAIVLAGPGYLHFLRVPAVAAAILGLFTASLAGALVLWRWRFPLPYAAPWYRLTVVTFVLIAVTLVLPDGSPRSPASNISLLSGLALAALIVPGVVGLELFYRGALYSVLDMRWGAGAAVLGSALASALPHGGWSTGSGLLSAVVLGLFLGLSRSTTGSITPALLSQALIAVTAIPFVFLMLR